MTLSPQSSALPARQEYDRSLDPRTLVIGRSVPFAGSFEVGGQAVSICATNRSAEALSGLCNGGRTLIRFDLLSMKRSGARPLGTCVDGKPDVAVAEAAPGSRLNPGFMDLRFFRMACLAIVTALSLAVPESRLSAQRSPEASVADRLKRTAVSPDSLRARLFQFADDSMQGREFSTSLGRKATDYIECEVSRMGLRPGGIRGSFYQTVPLVIRTLDTSSSIKSADRIFRAGQDFSAEVSSRKIPQLERARPLYLGLLFDTAHVPTAETLTGRVVMVRESTGSARDLARQGPSGLTASFQNWKRALASAAHVIRIVGDTIGPDLRGLGAMAPRGPAYLPEEEGRLELRITRGLANYILDGRLDDSTGGLVGREITTNILFHDQVLDVARNVAAIVPGKGELSGQFVVLSAHSDHLGRASSREEHDAVKARGLLGLRAGRDSTLASSPEELAALREMLVDSLRKQHGPARVDTVFNGADDDASGVVALLEIAKALTAAQVAPKRSLLFIWHTGEESGLIGSRYFTEHPTVPLDSIVTVINLDRVGHGSAEDPAAVDMDGKLHSGGKGYLQLLGARRLSNDLGDAFDRVNASLHLGFNFDVRMDAPGHPQQVYCLSDHASYARFGIPSVLVTTGGNIDYHSVTDEPQYIDYAHLAEITYLVMATALDIANLDHRLVVDKPKPNPKNACLQ